MPAEMVMMPKTVRNRAVSISILRTMIQRGPIFELMMKKEMRRIQAKKHEIQ